MRRFLLLIAIVTALVGTRPSTAQGQLTPADSAAVLLDAARRFDASGEADIAEAIYRHILDRWRGTPAAAAAAERLRGFRTQGVEGSGKVELQVWTTLYGLWLGIAVPGALGADENEPYGVGLLLGGPAGFFGGRAIAGSRNLTEGQARAITFGGLWGGWQAYGWREVFDWGVTERCELSPWTNEEFCYTTEDTAEENFAAMIVGSLGGMAVGSWLANRPVSPGVATTVNFGALWGTWFGVASAVLMDLENDDLMAATLLGGNAGLAATMALAPGWNVSRNRARLVSIAGVIGGLGGAGVDLLVEPDDDKTAIAIPLAMSVAGLGIGAWATRDYDRDRVASAPPTEGPGGSLLSYRDGRWRLDAPVPFPVVLEGRGPRGPEPVPGLGVTLFRARFR